VRKHFLDEAAECNADAFYDAHDDAQENYRDHLIASGISAKLAASEAARRGYYIDAVILAGPFGLPRDVYVRCDNFIRHGHPHAVAASFFT